MGGGMLASAPICSAVPGAGSVYAGRTAQTSALPPRPQQLVYGRPTSTHRRHGEVLARANLKQLKDRMKTTASTQKITEAMKLVAAAKVRGAQEAVLNGRPFTEELVKTLYEINLRVGLEQLEVPLCDIRPVKTVLLVVNTSDRGLCGGYNNNVIKLAMKRHDELREMGVAVKFIFVGTKGRNYFKSNLRTDKYDIMSSTAMGSAPGDKDAGKIADEVFEAYVSKTVDKVEMVFSKFVSLTTTNAVVQSLLPLTREGVVRSAVDGSSMDATEDEIFKLTTDGGKFAVKRERVEIDTSGIDSSLEAVLVFDTDPSQILDTLMPLYLNALVLRSLQESLASELASRMQAMSQASDNAKKQLEKVSKVYFRARQAKITTELIEVVSGSAAVDAG